MSRTKKDKKMNDGILENLLSLKKEMEKELTKPLTRIEAAEAFRKVRLDVIKIEIAIWALVLYNVAVGIGLFLFFRAQ